MRLLGLASLATIGVAACSGAIAPQDPTGTSTSTSFSTNSWSSTSAVVASTVVTASSSYTYYAGLCNPPTPVVCVIPFCGTPGASRIVCVADGSSCPSTPVCSYAGVDAAVVDSSVVDAGLDESVVRDTPIPPGCAPNSALPCINGAFGWTCAAGVNPEVELSGLSCSVPQADGPNNDFCCFAWTGGTTTCLPDDTLYCAFPAFGYQCRAGADPTSLVPSLNCSAPVVDGPNDDFCCE
jgi:hypothetical protein